jgi:hypothetical protein
VQVPSKLGISYGEHWQDSQILELVLPISFANSGSIGYRFQINDLTASLETNQSESEASSQVGISWRFEVNYISKFQYYEKYHDYVEKYNQEFQE